MLLDQPWLQAKIIHFTKTPEGYNMTDCRGFIVQADIALCGERSQASDAHPNDTPQHFRNTGRGRRFCAENCLAFIMKKRTNRMNVQKNSKYH